MQLTAGFATSTIRNSTCCSCPTPKSSSPWWEPSRSRPRQVKFQAEKLLPLTRQDDRTYHSDLEADRGHHARNPLTSARTGLDSKPTFLSIGLLKDRAPRVTLRALGTGGHVTPDCHHSAVDLGDRRFWAGRALGSRPTGLRARMTSPRRSRSARARSLPLPLEKDRALLDHQIRHEVVLQADPPKIGTLLRFVAEADDRCAARRANRPLECAAGAGRFARRAFLRDPDPPARRARKFLAALEAIEKHDSGAGRSAQVGRLPESDEGSSLRRLVSSIRSPAGSPTRYRK